MTDEPTRRTVIVVSLSRQYGAVGGTLMYGPFSRDELRQATQILRDRHPQALLKRYQLRPLTTTQGEVPVASVTNTDDLIASGDAWQCVCGARTLSLSPVCAVCGRKRGNEV